MTQMYYTIAMSLFTGFSVAFNQHGLAAFTPPPVEQSPAQRRIFK